MNMRERVEAGQGGVFLGEDEAGGDQADHAVVKLPRIARARGATMNIAAA